MRALCIYDRGTLVGGEFNNFTQEDQPGIQGFPVFLFHCSLSPSAVTRFFPLPRLPQFPPLSLLAGLSIFICSLYLFLRIKASTHSYLFRARRWNWVLWNHCCALYYILFRPYLFVFTCLVERVSYFPPKPFSGSLGQHGRPFYFTSQHYSATPV